MQLRHSDAHVRPLGIDALPLAVAYEQSDSGGEDAEQEPEPVMGEPRVDHNPNRNAHQCCGAEDHRDPPRCTIAELTGAPIRSEEHTSELQSLMRTSYAVFCLKKK